MPSVTPRTKKSVAPSTAAAVAAPAAAEAPEVPEQQQEDVVMEDTPVVAEQEVVDTPVVEEDQAQGQVPFDETPAEEGQADQAEPMMTEEPAGEAPVAADAKETKKRKKHPKKHPENLVAYIKLLGAGMRVDSEGVHHNVSMDRDAYQVLNSMIVDLAERMIDEASLMARHVYRQTLSEKDFIAATRKCLPGELGAYARNEIQKALHKYQQSKAASKAAKDATGGDDDDATVEKKKGGKVAGSKSQSKSERAGLTMSVCRLKRLIERRSSNRRISEFAPVALAAVIQYLVYEFIELAQKEASDRKRIRVTCRDLKLSLENDAECSEMIRGSSNIHIAIRNSGEAVFIHKALLPKKRVAKNPLTTKPVKSVKSATKTAKAK